MQTDSLILIAQSNSARKLHHVVVVTTNFIDIDPKKKIVNLASLLLPSWLSLRIKQ